MASRFFTTKNLTLAQQIYAMRARYPDFVVVRKRGAAIWTGKINPSAMSEEYTVRIAYKLNQSPQVFVLHPILRRRGNSAIPHVYPGNRPCLYLPNSGEWHPGKSISATILPWLSLWLFYYEVWLATEEWIGGGVHPEGRAKTGGRER